MKREKAYGNESNTNNSEESRLADIERISQKNKVKEEKNL